MYSHKTFYVDAHSKDALQRIVGLATNYLTGNYNDFNTRNRYYLLMQVSYPLASLLTILTGFNG
jgi:hypothetical protein